MLFTIPHTFILYQHFTWRGCKKIRIEVQTLDFLNS